MKLVNSKEIPPIVMDNETVKNVAGRVMIGKEDGANVFLCLIPHSAPEL